MSMLPDAVARVAAFLEEAGAEARIEELAASCATAADAAIAVGCPIGQIVKSIALVCGVTPVLALVPGDLRVDADRIARGVGQAEGRVATATEVERITGFTPGTVAPFPLAERAEVLLESRLLDYRVVWVGGGSTRHMVALAPRELLRLTGARARSIAR
jgi:prolyl-tRNA editing enzyme YbaK/EbsC (Cys-tRNA(Pro) deacylase)